MSNPKSSRPRPSRSAGSELQAAGTAQAARAGGAARAAGPPSTMVVGITGASGVAYAARLVEQVVRSGWRVHLVVTAAGRLVLADELGVAGLTAAADLGAIWPREILAHVAYWPAEMIEGPPASGSFAAKATVVIPCSMNTLGALAHGLAGNLVQRAAYVALKEGRPLVVVPREMPLTQIDFENMGRLAGAGATVMPAMPGFYHRPQSVGDLVDFVVAKVMDRLGIAHRLAVRWQGSR
jgi:flavin prenyltransferase